MVRRTASVVVLSAAGAAAVSLKSVAQLRGQAAAGQGTEGWPFGTLNPFASSVAAKKSKSGEYRQTLENLGDIQYTGEIKVGGQKLKAIIDTGSFELLAFGANCSACGSKAKMYDSSKSKKHSSSNFRGVHSYGSGTCYSVEGTDTMAIGPLNIKEQIFWEVYDASMPILEEDSFHAIFGVGPPSTAVTFAEEEAKEVHKELKEYEKSGQKVTKEIQDTVDYYDAAAKHAANVTSVAQHLALQNMSVCLGKGSGSPGYFIWNSTAAQDEPEKFKTINVKGDIYWSAKLTDVKASHSKHGKVDTGACGKQKCSAVIDTGTSLIAAPSDFVYEVDDMVNSWMQEGGSCNDLSGLPDLKFKLNDRSFTLPPQAYVGSLEETDSELSTENIRKFMPHLHREKKLNLKARGNSTAGLMDCQVLLMTMDADSQFGPLWILGMPLFREYYTSFQFELKPGDRPQARTMSFSVPDEKCEPAAAKHEKAKELSSKVSKRKALLKVNPSKILVPRLARRAQQTQAAANPSSHTAMRATFRI